MQMLRRTWVKFFKDEINPITKRKGVWRVMSSHSIRFGYCVMILKEIGQIGIFTEKKYPKGSFINPSKAIVKGNKHERLLFDGSVYINSTGI